MIQFYPPLWQINYINPLVCLSDQFSHLLRLMCVYTPCVQMKHLLLQLTKQRSLPRYSPTCRITGTAIILMLSGAGKHSCAEYPRNLAEKEKKRKAHCKWRPCIFPSFE